MGYYQLNKSLEQAVKSNRGKTAVFSPSDLANLKIWFKPDGLLFNGGNLIHQWTDASGNGNHLLQAVETNKPLRVAGLLNGFQGVRFDGVDNSLKAVNFTWNQPETIYIVLNQVSWTINDSIFDGATVGRGRMNQEASTPRLRITASVGSAINADFTIGTFHIGTVIFNGVNSLLQHNNDAAWTGNAGTNNMGGFILGKDGGGATRWSDIEVMEVVGVAAAHNATQIAQVGDYLNAKYSIY